MIRRRWVAFFGVVAMTSLSVGEAGAEPTDYWPITHGINCVDELYNPIDPDTGLRDSAGDPAPNSVEWRLRDRERRDCATQRQWDRAHHPSARFSSGYGGDWYRQPNMHNNVRFRYDTASVPNVPAVEIYRPCPTGECPDLPAGLERFDPPYPVVLIVHSARAGFRISAGRGSVHRSRPGRRAGHSGLGRARRAQHALRRELHDVSAAICRATKTSISPR